MQVILNLTPDCLVILRLLAERRRTELEPIIDDLTKYVDECQNGAVKQFYEETLRDRKNEYNWMLDVERNLM